MDSAQPLSGSSAEAPAWYSNKNSNNYKNGNRAVDDG